MQAYSAEMPRDALSASELGAATHEVAFELGVSKSWVRRVKQEYFEQGLSRLAAHAKKDADRRRAGA